MLVTGYAAGDLVTAKQLSDWQQRQSALHSHSTQVIRVSLALPHRERFQHEYTAQHSLGSKSMDPALDSDPWSLVS